MSGHEILLREETAYDHLGGGFAFDDIDMLISERDGSLIPVAMFNGVHVCQQCGGAVCGRPDEPPAHGPSLTCGGHGVPHRDSQQMRR